MEELKRFVMLAKSGRFTVTDLCEQFGISRKTGHKYLERFAALGAEGLQPRSHRPNTSPQRIDENVEALILADRRLHRTWGPKKLQKVLEVKHGIERPPACSTIAGILYRHGLSVPRRRRPDSYPSNNDGLTKPTQPNHVWTVDFKGWFLLGNDQRCDPLTVEAHLFVAFLAYCLSITLRQQLRKIGGGLMPRSVFEQLATVQMLDVAVPTTDGRELLLVRRTEPSLEVRMLLDQLGLDLPPQAPPRIRVPQVVYGDLWHPRTMNQRLARINAPSSGSRARHRAKISYPTLLLVLP